MGEKMKTINYLYFETKLSNKIHRLLCTDEAVVCFGIYSKEKGNRALRTASAVKAFKLMCKNEKAQIVELPKNYLKNDSLLKKLLKREKIVLKYV